MQVYGKITGPKQQSEPAGWLLQAGVSLSTAAAYVGIRPTHFGSGAAAA